MSIPFTVVGGYLGSGKTVLVNDLLRQTSRRIAVLVNDFGEVNIDAGLIRSVTGDVVELANGCICCSLRDGVAEVLERLARRTDLDAVVVEISGVGDPGQVTAWASHPGFSPAGTLVCADAGVIARLLSDPYRGDSVIRQLESADLILLTKCDVADGDAVAGAEQRLAMLCPAIPTLRTAKGPGRWVEISRRLTMALRPSTAQEPSAGQEPSAEQQPSAAQGQSAGREWAAARHGCTPVTSADPQVRPDNARHPQMRPDGGVRLSQIGPDDAHHPQAHSRRLVSAAPVCRESLVHAMGRAAPALDRAKGIVRLDTAADRRTLLQLSGSGLELEDQGAWVAGDVSELVLIATGPDGPSRLEAASAELASVALGSAALVQASPAQVPRSEPSSPHSVEVPGR